MDVLVAKLLRARGFVAVTTQEAGLLGSTDDEQLAHAISERKALLTHNRRDFEGTCYSFFYCHPEAPRDN